MAKQKISVYRRKREGRTNYKKRLLLLKSNKPRLIIRKTNGHLIMQVAEYQPIGDKIITGVHSSTLKKLGWQYSCINLPACYLTGFLLGTKLKSKKIDEAIADLGFHTTIPGSRVYAAIKGARDAGLKVPASEEVFPSDERIAGEHIARFFKINTNPLQFTSYKKKGLDPSKMKHDFDMLKNKIKESFK